MDGASRRQRELAWTGERLCQLLYEQVGHLIDWFSEGVVTVVGDDGVLVALAAMSRAPFQVHG